MVLLTVTGKDAPGITAELTGILAQKQVKILDIGQAVIHRLLSLSILFEMDSEDQNKTVIKDLLFKATELGLKLEFQVLTDPSQTEHERMEPLAYRYAITLIADQIPTQALNAVTQTLANYHVNIDEIERLSESGFSCLEMMISAREEIDRRKLKKELLEIAHEQQIDIALQAEGLYRRAKRLVVFDMDSTLIQNEVIDEFARERGVYDEIAELTHQAMAGKLNFDDSLRKRCEKLQGLTLKDVDRVFDRLIVTPGAHDLIRVLKKLGYKTALISGGFSVVAERMKEKLSIDYSYANQLEFDRNGVATGKVIPPVINAQRKADLLDVISQQERIHLDQVIAIGDGANDILMLEKAGLGIAFNAKPVVRERADLAINQKNLKSVLYLLGISGRDLNEILS